MKLKQSRHNRGCVVAETANNFDLALACLSKDERTMRILCVTERTDKGKTRSLHAMNYRHCGRLKPIDAKQ